MNTLYDYFKYVERGNVTISDDYIAAMVDLLKKFNRTWKDFRLVFDEYHFSIERYCCVTFDVSKKVCGVIHISTQMNLPSVLFALAHELRHIIQAERRELIFDDDRGWVVFRGIQQIKPITAEEYMRQDHEVDANAFAAVICSIDIEDLRPSFRIGVEYAERIGYSTIVRKELQKW